MMLNGCGAVKRSVAEARPADDMERPQARRRPVGQALAMGAPLGAGFLGLLLMRGDAAAAAEAEGGGAGAVAEPAGDRAALAEAGAAQPWAGQGMALPLAVAAGGAGIVAPGGVAEAGRIGDDVAGTLPGEQRPTGTVPAEAAHRAETMAPAAPDIGDVMLAFGSEAPFAFPEEEDGSIGYPDENIGNLGDPRDIVREPIQPDEGTDAAGGEAGPAPSGNPGLKIVGTPHNDYLVGTDGDDIIYAVSGKNTVLGGAGNDIIYGGTGNDILRGGPGNDIIYGGGGNNEIYGDEGDNLLFGGTGNDTIYGGTGNDRLDGVTGINKLYAGTGNSTLVVNDWRDVAIGNDEGPNGGGTDTLEVAPGFAASLRGKFSGLSADGSTTFVMGASPAGRALPDDVNGFKWQVDSRIDQVRLAGDDPHDVVASDKGNTIWGNDGDNRLYGGAGDDVLYAGGGTDTLHGGAGNDTLHAGAGHNFLHGGEGDDVLYGGPGESELHGGEGDDLYVFGLAEGGRNTIFDHSGVNRLRFDGLEDPADLEARMDGQDLIIGHGGADIVRIADYADNRGAFAGIEHEGEVVPLDSLMGGSVAAAGAESDLLAIYLGPQSVEAGDDILDPAWLAEDGPAHDAPFALYESGAGFADGPSATAPPASGSTDDMLGSFMRGEPLWTGPEDGLYVPDAAAYPGGAEEARG